MCNTCGCKEAEEFGAETFDETYRMKGATKSLISDVLRKHGYDDFNELESENLKFLLYDVYITGMEVGMESASYNAEEFGAESKPTLENLKIALKQRNSANCQCDNPNVQSWKVNGKCHVCNEIKKIQAMIDDYDAEEFGAEWRGRWDVGNERKSGENYYFTYYIRKTEANPQAFEVLIRGRSPEGRELIRQASKNPIFRNLKYVDKIKIGFFIQNQVNWEGNIIKGHYQVYLPKLVEGKRGKQVFSMTPSNLIMDNYGEPVIEGLYLTKQEAVNAIYYYFDEMEYPFHISNWPLENSWEFNWDEEFGAEDDVEILYERWKDGELTDEETLSLIDILDYSDSDNDGKMLSHMIRWIEDENSEGMSNLRRGIKERFGAETFEATKGMDTYAQPIEELKIKPTKTKVGILLASIVAGGLWYSNKMKE